MTVPATAPTVARLRELVALVGGYTARVVSDPNRDGRFPLVECPGGTAQFPAASLRMLVRCGLLRCSAHVYTVTRAGRAVL